MKKPKEKKPQGEKPGKVIRVRPRAWKFIARNRIKKETIASTVERLLGLLSDPKFVLSSDVFTSAEEARGEAVLRAVRRKVKTLDKPLRVIEVE